MDQTICSKVQRIKKGAVHRRLINHHQRVAIMKECKFMAGKHHEGRERKDQEKARIEQAWQNLVATILAMENSSKYKGDDLISISSGCVAPKDTRDLLITSYRIWQNGAKAFVEDRMTK